MAGLRFGFWPGIGEDVTVPKVGVKLVERVFEPLEGGSVYMRNAEEASVQPVGPAVVGALNPARKLP